MLVVQKRHSGYRFRTRMHRLADHSWVRIRPWTIVVSGHDHIWNRRTVRFLSACSFLLNVFAIRIPSYCGFPARLLGKCDIEHANVPEMPSISCLTSGETRICFHYYWHILGQERQEIPVMLLDLLVELILSIIELLADRPL